MNYPQAINYLYTRLPMFSRQGAAALKPSLANTEALCATLGHPEKQFPSVHIGGTNGKGSVSHMLAAILQAAGYKTGLYTSPHLYDFRERIRISGKMISESAVVDFVQRIEPEIEKIEPSFFEITVAMAFDYFARDQVDIAIVEVGLGGRLDSTNVIVPELSVITNIGFDHTDLLGDKLPAIASEKAGIIKDSVPVIIGAHNEETDPFFRKKAEQLNAALFFAQDHFQIKGHRWTLQGLAVELEEKDLERIVSLQLDLPGIYQMQNLQTVLLSVELLKQKGWKIEEEHVSAALKNVKGLTGLMGRWDVLRSSPTLVLDVAHNPDGISQMLRHLSEQTYECLHIVLGMVKDKDVDAVLKLLPTTAKFYFSNARIPRAMDAQELKERAENFSLLGSAFEDVNLAVSSAVATAAPDDLILVCGSIFLVAEVSREQWVA